MPGWLVATSIGERRRAALLRGRGGRRGREGGEGRRGGDLLSDLQPRGVPTSSSELAAIPKDPALSIGDITGRNHGPQDNNPVRATPSSAGLPAAFEKSPRFASRGPINGPESLVGPPRGVGDGRNTSLLLPDPPRSVGQALGRADHQAATSNNYMPGRDRPPWYILCDVVVYPGQPLHGVPNLDCDPLGSALVTSSMIWLCLVSSPERATEREIEKECVTHTAVNTSGTPLWIPTMRHPPRPRPPRANIVGFSRLPHPSALDSAAAPCVWLSLPRSSR